MSTIWTFVRLFIPMETTHMVLLKVNMFDSATNKLKVLSCKTYYTLRPIYKHILFFPCGPSIEETSNAFNL